VMPFAQIPFDRLSDSELIPQAIIGKSAADLAHYLGVNLISGDDDFDSFEGVALVIDNGPSFALKHYRGYPHDTMTIYLSNEIRRLDDITKTISLISDTLRIPTGWIVWQRRDDPDL